MLGSRHGARNSEVRQRRRLRQRQHMLPHIHALSAALFDTFPQAFFHEPAQVQPLKKGITQDICAVLSARYYVVHEALH
jgi:sRNA-binding protein